jgi:hypothetical protein
VRKPVVAKRVNNRRLNARALRQYGEFWAAIQAVGEAIEAGRKVALKANDKGRISWSAPTSDELRLSANRAGRSVEVMSRSAKRWQQELITREWKR